jgi:spore coat protein H
MEKLGIFHLQSDYAELRINGNTAGLYLGIQKPEDYIRSLESTLLIRREYEGRYTIEYSGGEDTREQVKRLKSIPKLTKKLEGQQLYESLNAIVQLDHYFKWLAFNYLIRNGDYTDELFLYLAGEDSRFDIIPWDYDDIFQRQPHNGFEKRNKVLNHKLLFSGEAYLDIIIDKDSFLYAQFLHSFQEVLDILTPEVLKQTFEKVFLELYPYFMDQELIAQSESDHYGLTSLSILKDDLQNQFRDLLILRLSIKAIIESELGRLVE